MLETPEEMDHLQQLLDRSAATAGPHLRGIITGERRLSAAQAFQDWLDQADAVGARIAAEKMFTFSMKG